MKTINGMKVPDDLTERVSKIVSEILSDRYDAKITVVFSWRDEGKKDEPTEGGNTK